MLLHPPPQPLHQVAPPVFLWVVAYGNLSIGFAWDYRLGSFFGQNRAHLVGVVGFVPADHLGPQSHRLARELQAYERT